MFYYKQTVEPVPPIDVYRDYCNVFRLFLIAIFRERRYTKDIHGFYVVRTVHFGMKLYNDQRNAQVFNSFIYLLLPYRFRAFF
jgi:hypothetical protein